MIYMPYVETPTKEGPPVKNKQKKALVRFVLAGVVALIIHKVEDVINDKTDELYPDQDSDQQTN